MHIHWDSVCVYMYLKTFENHGHLCQNQSIEYYKEMYELSDDIGHIKKSLK